MNEELFDTNEHADCQLTLRINDHIYQLTIQKSRPILMSILDHKINVPFNCTEGRCRFCMAQIKKGKAILRVHFFKGEKRYQTTSVLCCQGMPASDALEIAF